MDKVQRFDQDADGAIVASPHGTLVRFSAYETAIERGDRLHAENVRFINSNARLRAERDEAIAERDRAVAALLAAYDAGFMFSGEGCNGEHGPDIDHPYYVKARDEYFAAIAAAAGDAGGRDRSDALDVTEEDAALDYIGCDDCGAGLYDVHSSDCTHGPDEDAPVIEFLDGFEVGAGKSPVRASLLPIEAGETVSLGPFGAFYVCPKCAGTGVVTEAGHG